MLAYDIVPPASGGPATCAALFLHGLGDTRRGWRFALPLIAPPGMAGIFAEAPLPYGQGASWFTIHEDFSVEIDDIRRSREAVEALIEHLRTTLRLPASALFLIGFSQGCLMVLDTALRAAQPFAGVVGISGFMRTLDDFPAAFGAGGRHQPLFLCHGLHDPLIPIAAARAYRDGLHRLGLSFVWREYDTHHDVNPVEIADIRAWLAERAGSAAARSAPARPGSA